MKQNNYFQSISDTHIDSFSIATNFPFSYSKHSEAKQLKLIFKAVDYEHSRSREEKKHHTSNEEYQDY